MCSSGSVINETGTTQSCPIYNIDRSNVSGFNFWDLSNYHPPIFRLLLFFHSAACDACQTFNQATQTTTSFFFFFFYLELFWDMNAKSLLFHKHIDSSELFLYTSRQNPWFVYLIRLPDFIVSLMPVILPPRLNTILSDHLAKRKVLPPGAFSTVDFQVFLLRISDLFSVFRIMLETYSLKKIFFPSFVWHTNVIYRTATSARVFFIYN